MKRLRFLLSRLLLAGATLLLAADRKPFDPAAREYINSIGIRFLRVPAGSFSMGSDSGDYDERPVHQVTISHDFFLSETEITAAQFQEFRMDYQDVGRFPPYATGVSWNSAVAFSEWLTRKEKLPYRLPTEAEWEYASGKASALGVKNVDSEAPEWVLDWHAPYSGDSETDPVGPATGIGRVVRGGGIMGPYGKGPSGFAPEYRRRSNRASLIPNFEGRHPVGIRLVLAAMPSTAPRPVDPPFWSQFVKQAAASPTAGPDPHQPWFRQRSMLPIPPEDVDPDAVAAAGIDPGVLGHNHSGGIAAMPNGDLLVIDFSAPSTSTEYLPSTSFVAFRRRFGSEQWDFPSVFYDLADVNDQSALLWNDSGTIRFFGGGIGLDGVPFRMQTSHDNGAHWTPPEFPLLRGPIGGFSPQPITSAFRAGGRMYIATDAVGGESMLWASDDEGRTWVDTGGRTGGRHTTFVVLKDGSILGMGGKNTDIDGFMPKSISRDGGRTWTISKTPFPALGSNQRPIILRLASGRLFFASDWQSRTGQQPAGVTEHGAFVALSDDEGATWRTRTIPGALPHEAHVLPKRTGWAKDNHGYATLGYVTAAQGPNGLIHVVTSMNHPAQEFELNEAWIQSNAGASEGAPAYRRNGPETLNYANGTHQYQVTWRNGVKTGTETYWAEDGRKRWEWHREPDGRGTWTQYWNNGNLKHVSHWVNGVCEGEAAAYDPSGRLTATYHFVQGDLERAGHP